MIAIIYHQKTTFIISQFVCIKNITWLSLKFSYKAAMKMLVGTVVLPEGSTGRGSAYKLTSMVDGRIQFLVGCWTEGFRSSRAMDERPPSVLCHVGLSKGSSQTAADWEKKRETERTQDRNHIIYCNNLESDILCHDVFIRSESLRPAYTQGEVVTQKYEY